MKTLLVRPVLIASKEQTNLWSYKGRKLYYNQANFNDETFLSKFNEWFNENKKK